MRFVDGVEEVDGYDQDVDAAAVFGVARRSWRGPGRAGADGDAVVERLRPAGDKVGEKCPAEEGEQVGHFCCSTLGGFNGSYAFVRSVGRLLGWLSTCAGRGVDRGM